MTDDELRLSVCHARDQRFAEWLTHTLVLAAEANPDLVRTALAKLFDLSAHEAEAKRISGTLSWVAQQAQELRHLLAAVRADLDELEAKIDGLHLKAADGPHHLNGRA